MNKNTIVHSSPVPADAQSLAGVAAELLRRLFCQLDHPLRLRLWNGTVLQLGKAARAGAAHGFTLVCQQPAAVRRLVLGRDPLRMAEAYFREEVDIEGDIFAALALKDHLHQIGLAWRDRLPAALHTWRLLRGDRGEAQPPTAARQPRQGLQVHRHTRQENRKAIAFHYDVSNAFYALWLDRAMVYSCAYFEQPDQTLEAAQEAKLEHICRKLLLRPGQRLLDIGCGWGALVLHAARHHGVLAHGITLSQQQLELARQRIAKAGLQERVTVELCDYRDLPGEARFDRISSVGMFEHIGLKNLPLYFSQVHHLLKPGGLFLNHGITHGTEGWEKTLSSTFINRYVFPDGQLDSISNITRRMEHAHFEVLDVESLRPHYALTLRHWVQRLEQHHAEALRHVSESTWRIWRLYMAASALEFEAGDIGVYQILAAKQGDAALHLPLTRRHLYRAAPPVTGKAPYRFGPMKS
jgi:cyclopropane-fatty-acyl-phospholipid synthase